METTESSSRCLRRRRHRRRARAKQFGTRRGRAKRRRTFPLFFCYSYGSLGGIEKIESVGWDRCYLGQNSRPYFIIVSAAAPSMKRRRRRSLKWSRRFRLPEAPIFHKAASERPCVCVRAPHVVVREGVSAVARQATTFASLICTFCVFRPPPSPPSSWSSSSSSFSPLRRPDRPTTTETEKAHLFFAVPD